MARTDAKAFTLVELLVVIGIVGILAGILFPVLGKAREQVKVVQCMTQLKHIGSALQMYAANHRDYLPFAYPVSVPLSYEDGETVPGELSVKGLSGVRQSRVSGT